MQSRLDQMSKLKNLIERGNVAPTRWESINQMVQAGDVKSAVLDSGATSNCGMTGDPFQTTTEPSGKVFAMPDGRTTKASTKSKLLLDVREPAKTVDMVLGLRHNTLLSASKFANAGYVAVLTPEAVLIYDEDTYRAVDTEAVLRG